MSPGAVNLVKEEASFDRLRRLISVEAAVFKSEHLCHRVGQFFHVIRYFSKSIDSRPTYPAALAVGIELRFKAIAPVTSPCIQRFGPGMIVRVDFFLARVDHCVGIAGTVVRARAAWLKGS